MKLQMLSRGTLNAKRLLSTQQAVAKAQGLLSSANGDWDSLWKSGITPWDIGTHHPCLSLDSNSTNDNDNDIIVGNNPTIDDDNYKNNNNNNDNNNIKDDSALNIDAPTFLRSFLSGEKGKKKAIVPGCGSAHDAAQIARIGWETVGIDISRTAVENAISNVERTINDSDANRIIGNPRIDEKNDGTNDDNVDDTIDEEKSNTGKLVRTIGNLTLMEGDFFALDAGECDADFLFDHTFLCALDPTMRQLWAETVFKSLKKGGILAAAIFPIGNFEQGPPFAVSKNLYESLMDDVGLERIAIGKCDSIEPRKDRELLGIWRKNV